MNKKTFINWKAVYQYLLDYCNDTTIHGFKYMGEVKWFLFKWLKLIETINEICGICFKGWSSMG